MTFVFASDSEVVTWATVARNLGDPCSGAKPLSTAVKSSAAFRVEKTDAATDGKPFYSLLPIR